MQRSGGIGKTMAVGLAALLALTSLLGSLHLHPTEATRETALRSARDAPGIPSSCPACRAARQPVPEPRRSEPPLLEPIPDRLELPGTTAPASAPEPGAGPPRGPPATH